MLIGSVRREYLISGSGAGETSEKLSPFGGRSEEPGETSRGSSGEDLVSEPFPDLRSEV